MKIKKILRYADVKGFKYRDAKDQLKEKLDPIKEEIKPKANEEGFEDLAKRFLKEGMEGFRLGKFRDFEYKNNTKEKYSYIIRSFLLLKHHDKDTIKKLTCRLIYKHTVSTKPLKDYLLSEIGLWDMEVQRERLKHIPPTANTVVAMVSIIYEWAIENNIYKGNNPCKNFQWRQTRKIKAKLFDEDTDKILEHCEGKAFDYQPHFLCCTAIHLYTGKRSEDIFGVRWKPALSEEEKEICSGWLLDGWETADEPKFHLWNMKNRKGKNIHLDEDSVKQLKRLREANLRDRNAWALKSPFIFPQKMNPQKHATYGSYQKPLKKLNELLNINRLEGDNISKVKGKRRFFTFKIARKTAGTYFANEYGIEIASRKLDHASTKQTKDCYIVPDEKELEINNMYRRRNKKTLLVKADKESPWSKKALVDNKDGPK